jgi:hypothetical protein
VSAAWLMVAQLLAAGAEWRHHETVDGIVVESRRAKGSAVTVLRLTTTVSATPERLCEEAFGRGKFDPEEPDLKSRQLIEESADQRVTYDQISPPVVSNRDFAVRATRVRLPGGVCEMRFEAANHLAPKLPPGYVRIEKLKGFWRFEPQVDGKTKITYLVHADPAGSIPPFLVEGSRKTLAVRWVKLITARAQRTRDAGAD